ncbi:MAG TPA: hypothetical protein VJS69_11710, partial [Candidatus Krumholzibacteria bacterium]|nr:hypothetical protein [Candidatus Krumholzibacteria bacterium]
ILPNYRFSLQGNVVDEEGHGLANYPVVAMEYNRFDSRWVVLQTQCLGNWGYEDRRFVTLSDYGGYFRLRMFLCESAPESLAVGVVLPDTTVIGSILSRRALSYSPIETTFHQKEDGFLCDQTTFTTFPTEYDYDPVDSLSVVVPDSLAESSLF